MSYQDPGHASMPVYYDGLMLADQQDAPVVIDNDTRMDHTFQGQKVMVPDNPEKEAGLPPPGATVPAATICGLRRRTFYAILAVAAVLLIALIAGLAGGLTARRNSDIGDGPPETVSSVPSPNPSPTTTSTSSSAPSSSSTSMPPTSQLLENSKLATGRWPDGTVTSIYLAYQDAIGSLMLAIWNDRETTWASVNITDRMLRASFPVLPKLGTPLACVTAGDMHVLVIFLDVDNILRGVYTREDGSYMFWRGSALYEDSRIPAHPQSGLAAYWLHCVPRCAPSEADGAGLVRMFFEDEPGSLTTYIGAPWKESPDFSGTGRAGSGLATTPYYRSDSGARHMMLFFDTGEKLGMMTRKNNETVWVFDEAFAGATHPTFPGQQIAAAAFEVSPLGEEAVEDWAILAVQLERDGSLAATYWDPRLDSTRWTFGSPVELVGGPQPAPRFTAIAMSIDRRFYGIADGAILEYRPSQDDIKRFVFTGNVTLQS